MIWLGVYIVLGVTLLRGAYALAQDFDGWLDRALERVARYNAHEAERELHRQREAADRHAAYRAGLEHVDPSPRLRRVK